MTHLGSRVSDLLDGRLPVAEEERAWAHVHLCHPCRDLVEREGWVKTQLAGLSGGDRCAPNRLKSSLLSAAAMSASPARPCHPSTDHGRRLPSLIAVGGGAAGAAVFGVMALGGVGIGPVERRVPADLARPSFSSTPTTEPVVSTTQRGPRRSRGAGVTPTTLVAQAAVSAVAPGQVAVATARWTMLR